MTEASRVKRFLPVNRFVRAVSVAALIAAAAVGASAFVAPNAPPARILGPSAPLDQRSETDNNPPNRGWLRPDQWMQSLGDRLRKTADRILPPGQQLQIRVDDISLAGRLQPVYRPGQQDMRVMKE